MRRLQVLGGLLLAQMLGLAAGSGQAAGKEPQYLMFQLFTAGPGFTTETGRQAISKLPDPSFLDGEAKSIVDFIGERGDAEHRLGVMVGPLSPDHTDAQLRALVERTFAIAAKHRIAVGLHLDDSKFWLNRRDLWADPANVEWLDWRGTPNTGQYLNWGQPWKLAPQACFNSPAMLAEARRLAGSVIGPAVAAEIARLRQQGDEALFAGVIVGWETAIGRDHSTGRSLGYCALKNLGFSEASPPANPDRELERVVQGWIGTWAKGLAEAGVPAEKIYSHITFSPKKQFDPAGAAGRSYSSSVLHSPPAVAFGPTHRPGFSTYPDADMFAEVYAALADHAAPPWISAEGANVDIRSGPPRIPEEGMQDYLARMFNHGAALANVFGWGIGAKDNPFRRAAESEDARTAYRAFLGGVPLKAAPLASAYQRQDGALQTRMRALPEKIRRFQNSGGVMALVQSRVKRLEEFMKGGRLDALKSELDSVEAILDSKTDGAAPAASPAGFSIAALQQQMRSLPQKIESYRQQNGDISRIRQRVESIQKRVGAGELEKAWTELQALNPILDSP